MSEFVHLHCHTEYSLLDGAIRLNDLCARAKDFGMPAAAITDHGNLYGAAYFYTTCKSYGIKPVIGCEVYVTKDHRDKDSEFSRVRHHLILLAKNNEGYHNLVRLVSKGFLDGFHYKPRVDKALLRQHSEGLIALSACLAGEIPRTLMGANKLITNGGTFDDAIRQTQEYMDIYNGRFYLEVQANTLPDQATLNNKLLELAEHTKVPLVATNDCHYLNADDVEAHDVLLCIQTQAKVNDAKRMRFEARDLYYKSAEEMEQAFKHIPEALSNTVRIAEECHVEMDFTHHYFPVYELPEGMTLSTEFQRLAREGLKQRLELHPDRDTIDPKIYWDRLEMELKVICEMGFPGYFLIVQDFINWAKGNDIPVGPGRGSAAGSIVAWALRITNLDPLPYNLIFERFLNIERVSLPDIDVDFCEDKRTRVIQYVSQKYGIDSVSQITTFGKMKAKAVVRDVGRALDMSFKETDRIAKLIPDDLKMTIKKALDAEPELATLYKEDQIIRKLIDISMRLEGLSRHASTHAAGVVVSDKPMDEYLPIYRGKKGELVTQFDMKMVEKVGLVKFDFLGLRTMTLIDNTLKAIEEQGKKAPNLDILPLTDPDTYDVFSRGDTDGVFQVESSGMRQYLRMLRPNCFEDIIAMLALYRPGPLGSGMVDEFIKRKHGEVDVTYPLPSLEGCLKDTYGVIVYQEQVMQIAQIVAGYTLGGADLLRRAMGKKNAEAMAKERTLFVDGAVKNGTSKEKATEIFDLMEKFAEYGFNKSHATAYALLSYQTAYLKANYPSEYMAAVMSRSLSNITDITKLMDECKAMGIQTLGPDVNESNLKFTVNHDGNIRFGLGAVKGVGEAAVQSIVEERNTNGPFKGIFDFVQRVNLNACNKKNMECLALAGGFDSFPELKREQYFAVNSKGEVFLETLMRYGNRYQEDKRAAINSLFGGANVVDIATPEIPQGVERWGDLERLNKERDLVGIYLSAHPLDEFAIVLDHVCNTRMADLEDKAALAGREITMGGIVTSVRRGVSKNGNPYGIAKIEDYSGSTEIPFWGNDWVTYQGYLNEGTFLYIKARCQAKQWRQDELEVKITSMELLPDVKEELVQKITIIIPLSVLNSGLITELATLTKEHPGNTELYFKVTDDTDSRMSVDLISRPVKLSVGRDLITYLKERPELGFRIN